MQLQETILCATAATTSNPGLGQISIHDIHTGASLASFKQTNTGTNSVAVFESKNNQGGFILASQNEKSILNVYNFQKDQISSKIVLPERLTSISLDRRGNFCAGGTASGRIYLWETASGILFNAWDAHYRQVNVLRFTNDGSALVSGSSDSGVSVWSISRLLDDDAQEELMTPYCLLSDHTLPVTDILCGVGKFPNCRILTSSVDHSVKLWDLSSRSLLTTFLFPQPISCLAWDITEKLFFAASPDGSIHQMNLFHERESRMGGSVMEAVGGAGVTDIIRADSDEGRQARRRLITVGQPVLSICISLNSGTLLVGTSDGLIHTYDIPSHQLLRTISSHKGYSITYLQTMIKPPDLFGHTSLELGPGGAKDSVPMKPIVPFQRMKDKKARDAHEVSILLPSEFTPYLDEASSYSEEEFLRDHTFFVQPSSVASKENSDPISLKSKISELESEVTTLREQLSKAKGLNDVMWDTVVQRLVGETNGLDLPPAEDTEESQRSRKRGRAT